MRRIAYALALAAFISSCSNPMDVSDDGEVRGQDTNAVNDPGTGVSAVSDSTSSTVSSTGVQVNTATGEITKPDTGNTGHKKK